LVLDVPSVFTLFDKSDDEVGNRVIKPYIFRRYVHDFGLAAASICNDYPNIDSFVGLHYANQTLYGPAFIILAFQQDRGNFATQY